MGRALLITSVLAFSGALACSSGAPQTASDAAPETRAEASQQSQDPPGYEAWWYPECETADGHCPEEKCLRAGATVVGDRCAPYQHIQFGCVSRMTLVAGWLCFMRESNGDLIVTEFPPKGGGFVPCNLGFPPEEGALCRDGGTD